MAGARCTVCTHPEARAIDAAVIDGARSLRRIAADFGLAESSLRRHRSSHMLDTMATVERQKARDAASLLERIETLQARAQAILAAAERSGDLRTALSAIREARATLALLAEIEGRIDRGMNVTVGVSVNDEWPRLRGRLIAALGPFPEARQAVLAAIAEGDV